MALREIFAVMSAVLMLAGSIWQVYASLRYPDKIKTPVVGWLIMSVTLTLSFVTYWTTKEHNLVSNAANASAAIGVVVVFVGTCIAHVRSGEKLQFSSFQKWSLRIAGLIALSWMVMVFDWGWSGLVPNILTQILMIIAYCVNAEKMTRATKMTESFGLWGCICASSAIGIYLGCGGDDGLAIFYAIRATVCTAVMLVLMHQIKTKIERTVNALQATDRTTAPRAFFADGAMVGAACCTANGA